VGHEGGEVHRSLPGSKGAGFLFNLNRFPDELWSHPQTLSSSCLALMMFTTCECYSIFFTNRCFPVHRPHKVCCSSNDRNINISFCYLQYSPRVWKRCALASHVINFAIFSYPFPFSLDVLSPVLLFVFFSFFFLAHSALMSVFTLLFYLHWLTHSRWDRQPSAPMAKARQSP